MNIWCVLLLTMKWSEEQSEKSGVPPENSDRKMNKFVTVNETVKEDKEDIIIDNIKREIKNLSWFKPQIKKKKNS